MYVTNFNNLIYFNLSNISIIFFLIFSHDFFICQVKEQTQN